MVFPAKAFISMIAMCLSMQRCSLIGHQFWLRAKTDPKLHHALFQAALREMGAMQDHFMMLGRKSAIEKIASFLCVLATRVGRMDCACPEIDLPMSRSDIADFLGLTTETVCRTLTQLRKSDVIAIENTYRIIIKRPTELRRISRGDCATVI